MNWIRHTATNAALAILGFNLAILLLVLAGAGRSKLDRWMRRFNREVDRALAAHARAVAILLRSEYECVGGPYDGERVPWRQPHLSMYVVTGVYSHGPDHRLHFEQYTAIAFGGDDPEC